MVENFSPRILLVEDDPESADFTQLLLSGSEDKFDVEVVETLADARSALGGKSFDLILLDLNLPDSKGVGTIESVHAITPSTPIVLLTGTADEMLGVEAIKAGADDYLVKDNTYAKLLVRAIGYSIERNKLVGTNKIFKSVIESITDGIITIDGNGIIETFNRQSEIIFGYKAAEVLGKNISALMPEDERADHQKYTRESVLHAPRIINRVRDLEGTRKDGSQFPMELSVSPIMFNGQKIFVGVVRDITERKSTEYALKESEERFNLSQTFANIGTWDWTIETGELYWSDRIPVLFGHPKSELETSYENFIGAVHPDDRDSVSKAVSACVEMGVEYDIEHRVVWPDGTVRWLHESGDVVRDDAGKPVHMLGVVRDITFRKQVEEELELARDEADKANYAKSEFLSSMSHELRTPMNAILGFGQMLEYDPKEPLTEAQQNCVHHIMKGGQHLLELINDVLDLAKIEAGKVALSIEAVSLSEVIDNSLSLVENAARERNIEVSVSAAIADAPQFFADNTRVRQVLVNLMSNAVKYNRENGTLGIDCELTAGSRLRIQVTDSGAGIPKERQPELFKPFSRLDAENSEIEGTGIGLVVCKNLVEQMRGSIGFESYVGKGSTFWLELPIAEAPHEENAAAIAKFAKQAKVQFSGIDGNLLYVEDNPANLELMEVIVSHIEGLELNSAHTGELGIELARATKPDLIILDINLPGMNGIEVLKKLGEHENTKHIPVLALSAAATMRDIKKGREAGFLEYLTKPIDVLEVVDAIKSALESRKPINT